MLSTTVKELKEAWPDPVRMTYVQRRILSEKPQFFAWYRGIYEFMAAHLQPGPVNVELGSGSSLLSDFIPGLVKTNVIPLSCNDLTFNAYAMPFKDATVDNVILINVLHHFDEPRRFFLEASRVLRKNGRVLICDPFLSPLSFPLWRFLHPEKCDTRQWGYLAGEKPNPLLDANSATLTLLLRDYGADPEKRAPGLRLARKKYYSALHYWLAGGYNFPPFFPAPFIGPVLALERMLSPLGFLLASFAFAVFEKEGEGGQ